MAPIQIDKIHWEIHHFIWLCARPVHTISIWFVSESYASLRLSLILISNFFDLQVVRILLQNGARVNILDRTGKTPLDLARSKLMLMRSRLNSSATSESAKLFVEMSMLTGLLNRTLHQQLKDVDQFDDLEARLRKLTTKEIEDGADNLLTDVAGLTLN